MILECLVLWHISVVVPSTLAKCLIQSLQRRSPKLRRLFRWSSRSYIYCPNTDVNIEGLVQKCGHCKLTWAQAMVKGLSDYSSPFHWHMSLVAVDSVSLWLEVAMVSALTNRNTISKPREGLSDMKLLRLWSQTMTHHSPALSSGHLWTEWNSALPVSFKSLMGWLSKMVWLWNEAWLSSQVTSTPDFCSGTYDSSLSDRHCTFRITDEEELRTHLDLVKPSISQLKAKQLQNLVNSEDHKFAVRGMILVCIWESRPKWLLRKVVGFCGHVNLEIQTRQAFIHCHVGVEVKLPQEMWLAIITREVSFNTNPRGAINYHENYLLHNQIHRISLDDHSGVPEANLMSSFIKVCRWEPWCVLSCLIQSNLLLCISNN